jgi:flagellar motor switch protein FliN/FliY
MAELDSQFDDHPSDTTDTAAGASATATIAPEQDLASEAATISLLDQVVGANPDPHQQDLQSRELAYHLPPFTSNLLRVKVPVMVTLARKRQPVKSILELVPGSIIQFNKSCEEMLDLEISGHPAAVGECVKVGDKFGLRITSMIVPEEKFVPLQGKAEV